MVIKKALSISDLVHLVRCPPIVYRTTCQTYLYSRLRLWSPRDPWCHSSQRNSYLWCRASQDQLNHNKFITINLDGILLVYSKGFPPRWCFPWRLYLDQAIGPRLRMTWLIRWQNPNVPLKHILGYTCEWIIFQMCVCLVCTSWLKKSGEVKGELVYWRKSKVEGSHIKAWPHSCWVVMNIVRREKGCMNVRGSR